MEVWASRRGGVSYEAPPHDEDEEDEDSTPPIHGKCQKFNKCVCDFFRSMGLSNEDELLFIHSSWELLEKGSGKLSLALDYLVYRCFYALAILGFCIYAVAVKSNVLKDYPRVHFYGACLHILYSVLYTLHILTAKTHKSKVEKTDIEGHQDGTTPVKTEVSEHLASLDIQQVVRTKPHPIQTPDKVVWLLFNSYASLTLVAAFFFVTGLTKRVLERDYFVLNLVFIGYSSIATCVELIVNCIPLRIIHCIYAIISSWIYVLSTYVVEMSFTDETSAIKELSWRDNPLHTFLFYCQGSFAIFCVHVVLCGIAYIRNKIIYIFSRPSIHESHLGPDLAGQLNNMIENDKGIKEFVNQPDFHAAFEAEKNEELKLAREEEIKKEKIKERGAIMFRKGAGLFLSLLDQRRSEKLTKGSKVNLKESTKSKKQTVSTVSFFGDKPAKNVYRPYTSDMTIEEYLENLTYDDGIPRAPKVPLEEELQNINWVEEKQKMPKKIAISGLNYKNLKPKKWNEFYTPPDSLEKITLENRHLERGLSRRQLPRLEELNAKLQTLPQLQHVIPGTFAPKFEDGNKPSGTVNRKFANLNSNASKQTVHPPNNWEPKTRKSSKVHLFRKQLKDELKKFLNVNPATKSRKIEAEPSQKMTDQNFKAKANSQKPPHDSIDSKSGAETGKPNAPVKPNIIPKLKWYLGDSSFMPLPPLPEIKPKIKSEVSVYDPRAKLEKEKGDLLKIINAKMLSTKPWDLLIQQGLTKLSKVPEAPPAPLVKMDIKAEVGAAAYKPSEFIKIRTANQKLREAKKLAREQSKLKRPHFIALKVGRKKSNLEEVRRKVEEQEVNARRLAYEQMQKPRQLMEYEGLSAHPDDPDHPDNQILSLVLVNLDEKTRQQILIKNQTQGILKTENMKTDSTLPREFAFPKNMRVAGKDLKNKTTRSKLQLHARANALGPMIGSDYHPLKNKVGSSSDQDILTYHYLDDKLPHTGGIRNIHQDDLKHYEHHPGTHVHHPILNLEHSEGPHESLNAALKEHVSVKLKDMHKNRYLHPSALERQELKGQGTTLAPTYKDSVIGNPLRIVAFHPIVQFRALTTGEKKEVRKDLKLKPKASEIYPRQELKKLEETHSENSIGSDKSATHPAHPHIKKKVELKDLLAAPVRPKPPPKHKH